MSVSHGPSANFGRNFGNDFEGNLGAIWGHLGAILGHLGAILGHLGAILDDLGTIPEATSPVMGRLGLIRCDREAP